MNPIDISMSDLVDEDDQMGSYPEQSIHDALQSETAGTDVTVEHVEHVDTDCVIEVTNDGEWERIKIPHGLPVTTVVDAFSQVMDEERE